VAALCNWSSASPNGTSRWPARSSHAAAARTQRRASLVLALAAAGSHDEALSAATGLIDAAEATGNPSAVSLALLAEGYVSREAEPVRALDALRRGLTIAQDNGQRSYETHMAASLARIEAAHGNPLAALDYLTRAIRNYDDSGTTTQMHTTLAVLAVFLHRLGRSESAATISGSARGPFTTAVIPELDAAITNLRGVLGDQTFESLARMGEATTTPAIVTYAYDQIDQARAELNTVPK
jgi:tetratricopeptide (TPR) repeat protein